MEELKYIEGASFFCLIGQNKSFRIRKHYCEKFYNLLTVSKSILISKEVILLVK